MNACVIYATIPSFWLVIHPGANYWRLRKGSPYRFLAPLWIAMWIVLGALTAPWRAAVLYPTAWTWLPAALLLFSLDCGSTGAPEPASAWLNSEASPNSSPDMANSAWRHPAYAPRFAIPFIWDIGAR